LPIEDIADCRLEEIGCPHVSESFQSLSIGNRQLAIGNWQSAISSIGNESLEALTDWSFPDNTNPIFVFLGAAE
jgi:hypothetical protein